jgi:AcrR family transcriptional regulator
LEECRMHYDESLAGELTNLFIWHIILNNKPTAGLLKSPNMARTVKQEEYELRRTGILDVAQRFVYTKGYEHMSIQDILAELHISKGAFYHYFDSKQSLLEALIERMAKQVIQLLLPIVQDEHLPAPEKLQCVFDAASRWKTDRKELLISLVNAWYTDDNAILRQKAKAALLPLIAPLITTIVRQGVKEGVFQTAYPDQVSWIIFSVLQDFGDTLISLIMQQQTSPESFQHLEELSASHQDAVERVLGAEPGSLPLFDTAILREWFPPSNSPQELIYERHRSQ